jgi:hypothetical protein
MRLGEIRYGSSQVAKFQTSLIPHDYFGEIQYPTSIIYAWFLNKTATQPLHCFSFDFQPAGIRVRQGFAQVEKMYRQPIWDFMGFTEKNSFIRNMISISERLDVQ